MSVARKVVKNTSLIFIAQIVGYGLIFFVTLFMARYLGADGYGVLSLALAFTTIFNIFTDLGLGILTVREVSRNKSLTHKFIENILVIKIILSGFTLFLVFVTVNLIGYPQIVVNVVYILTLSTIFGTFSSFFYNIFQAYQKMQFQSLGIILNGFLTLIGVLLAIHYQYQVISFAVVYLIVSILIFTYIFSVFLKKCFVPKLEVDWEFWKLTIKEAWPFGITGLSGMLYTYIDSILLSILKGTMEVGWYSAVYRLMILLLFVPNAVNTAIFPVMSEFYTSSTDSLKLTLGRYFKYMIIIGIPLGFGITLLADKIILLIFGNGFTESIIILQILIWAIVFTFAGAAFYQLLQSINKQLIITKISAICLVINIILNLILIPSYSYIGASFATLITEILLEGCIVFFSYRLNYGIPKKVVLIDILKVLIASFVMCAFIIYFRDLNLFILVLISIILYFIVLYIVRGVDDIDMMIIKKILNRN